MRQREERHSLQTLAIMPSWECDLACHHCVFNSSPKKKGRLPIRIATDAIDEIARATTARCVTVSGGEAFLDFDYLIALGESTRKAGLAFRVVTNGSFAESIEIAKDKISTLKRVGIESMALSWDEFHGQFVDPYRVRNTIRACREMGVSVRLTVVISRCSKLGTAVDLIGDDAFELPITQVKCLPVGRAERKIRPQDLLSPAEIDMRKSCRSDFDTLSLTPNGDVFPCCAVGGFTEGIKLGRFPEESIETLLIRRDSELVWTILASQGPAYFLDRISSQQREQLGLVGAPVHDCVACNRLFRSADGMCAVNGVVEKLKAKAVEVWQYAQFVDR